MILKTLILFGIAVCVYCCSKYAIENKLDVPRSIVFFVSLGVMLGVGLSEIIGW
jgi:hypothetical protein